MKTKLPQRIQRKRSKGWTMPPNTVYVGRPTQWGNPFKVGGYYRLGKGWTWCQSHVEGGGFGFTLMESVEQCAEWYRQMTENHTPQFVQRLQNELRGKDLCCWCKVGDPCHADILLEIANQ